MAVGCGWSVRSAVLPVWCAGCPIGRSVAPQEEVRGRPSSKGRGSAKARRCVAGVRDLADQGASLRWGAGADPNTAGRTRRRCLPQGREIAGRLVGRAPAERAAGGPRALFDGGRHPGHGASSEDARLAAGPGGEHAETELVNGPEPR